MVRLKQFLGAHCTRQNVWHFTKYGSVGFSSFLLNASLVWWWSHYWKPEVVSGIVFAICGQVSFFGHALLTWRATRERKLRAAWVLFVPANWAAAGVNFAAFSFMVWLGAWPWLSYIVAMLVSVPLTYAWNAIAVFRKETKPKELVLRLWLRLVEWNNPN